MLKSFIFHFVAMPFVCLFGNIIEMNVRGFLNLSSLRWVVFVVFAFGWIHSVGRSSLRGPFWHYFKLPQIRTLIWHTICIGLMELFIGTFSLPDQSMIERWRFYIIFLAFSIPIKLVGLGLTMWCLWRERNAHCFDGQGLSVEKLKYLLLKSLYEWI